MELPIPILIFQNKSYKCLVHNMEKTKDKVSSSAHVAIGDEALVKIKTEIGQDSDKIEDEAFENEGKQDIVSLYNKWIVCIVYYNEFTNAPHITIFFRSK